jgi:hypothetical protein
MAYREFYKPSEQQMHNPDIIGQSVASLFNTIATQQVSKRNAESKFNYALDYGQFENDNDIISKYVGEVTSKAKNDIRQYGRITPETNKLMTQGQEFAANSKAQATRIKDIYAEINKRADDDVYYDYQPDKELLKNVAVGADGEMNAFNRGKELDKVLGQIGSNPKSFKRVNYTSDYVSKLLGEKSKSIESGNTKYSSGKSVTSPFLDYKTGKNEVTDDHAINYINSREDVGRELDHRLRQNIASEVERMKASGDSRTAWMKGLPDEKIVDEIIRNPSKNILNKQDYGVRKRDLAKDDLRAAADITEKISYETKRDTSKTNGLYDNDKIAIGDFQEAQNIGTNKNFTPGYTLQIADGTTNKPITINQSTSSKATNARTGQFNDMIGGQNFNLKSVQAQIFDRSGRAVMIDASDVDVFKQKLESMTDADFKNLDTQMAIGLRGYTVNKGNVLGEVSKRKSSLQSELAKAKDSGDNERISILEERLESLNGALEEINGGADDFSDEDVINTLRENSINVESIYSDLLVKAADSDLSFINSVTEGLNLKKQDKWSPAMKQAADIYKDRYDRAAARGFGGYNTPMTEVIEKRSGKTAKKTSTTSPTITSQEEYDKLPSGSEYMDSTGKRYKKK